MHPAHSAWTEAPSATRPLELLERSLAYARPVLAAVPGHDAASPTPCPDWDLADLLVHMVDGFTAFIQGATGVVSPLGPVGLPRELALLAGHLLDLGCGVLSEWTSADQRACLLGLTPLPADVVLEVAALEVAVHGWDVSRACAPDRDLPTELAAALLPVAVRRISTVDRAGRFGPVVAVVRRRDPAALLLAQVGRRPS